MSETLKRLAEVLYILPRSLLYEFASQYSTVVKQNKFNDVIDEYECRTNIYERNKIFFFLNFNHVVMGSHSEVCSLKQCTLSYSNSVFEYHVLYFGSK